LSDVRQTVSNMRMPKKNGLDVLKALEIGVI
jgi:hypothetical protein